MHWADGRGLAQPDSSTVLGRSLLDASLIPAPCLPCVSTENAAPYEPCPQGAPSRLDEDRWVNLDGEDWPGTALHPPGGLEKASYAGAGDSSEGLGGMSSLGKMAFLYCHSALSAILNVKAPHSI